MTFFAHSLSGEPEERWHRLAEHLDATGALAEVHGRSFGAGVLAHAAGLLHDVGKYTEDFQRRLRGESLRVDHSTAGARISVERYGNVAGTLLAYAIAGHHAGLANGRDMGERTTLRDRLRAATPELAPRWQQEISLPGKLALPTHLRLKPGRKSFQASFFCRMLFSCLVDADFIDTEAFYATTEDRGVPRGGGACLDALGEALDRYLSRFMPDTLVNRLRAEILEHARAGAELPPGLFSMSVPTGGGKTLASLAFALDHARRHGMHRVIYVIPFTSIVEQSAAVFRHAFGDLGEDAVLEHHSAFDDDRHKKPEAREKLRRDMQNWDAPVVVTTAVQFFESLFADRPSRCRKLHNIANSVIVLDEAQVLPLKLLRPCIAAIDELALNYRASVVLCTATQPALQKTNDPARSFADGLEDVRELAPDPSRLHGSLKRVRVKHIGEQTDDELADQITRAPQALCIVNNRRHARSLYTAIAGQPGARHLTTLMCARHRSHVLAKVRAALSAGEPVRLIATSLIEAGVDVDFPLVLRAEAGLDSIAQAAGRCNREGKRRLDDSEVRIFQSPDWNPPAELAQFAQTAREVLRLHADDPLCPEAIERYFRLLYWQRDGQDSSLDAAGILSRLAASDIDGLPFEAIARDFRMIETVQRPVIVPYDESARRALRDLEFADRPGGIARSLQPYLVQIPQDGFDALIKVGAVQPIARERFGEQFMQLVNADLYDDRLGLGWEDPAFIRAEHLVC